MAENSLQEAVKSIIDKYDPINLFRMGCPADEYEHEVKKILPILQEVTGVDSLQEKIHAVFVEVFDKEMAGPKENYRMLSEEIYSLKSQ